MKTEQLLELIRSHKPLTVALEVELIIRLALPAMLAQISTILMFYIDASMVGSLGAHASAAVGLVSSTLWVFGGLNGAVAMGFAVQAAHAIGAGDDFKARQIMRQSYVCVACTTTVLITIGVLISKDLPRLLGGDPAIFDDASNYFLIFILAMPVMQLNFLSGAMLRCSGNMKIPSLVNVLMCLLDVLFNFLFIFETRDIEIFSRPFTIYGAGLGVSGAALGTACAFMAASSIMTYFAAVKSPKLSLLKERGSFKPQKDVVKRAVKIGVPLALQHLAISLAQIVSIMIVAPLGIAAISAHSFAITVESMCYMPGFGISEAATTLTGQSIGARRPKLTFAFAKLAVLTGIIIMSFSGLMMYVFAPEILAIMTPVQEIRDLAVGVLRIEAFAQPLCAVALVSHGVFVGAGDTLAPSIMNFASMWLVRLTSAYMMAPHFGLYGVWMAMCGELCFRGLIFGTRLLRRKWLIKVLPQKSKIR